MDEPKSIPCTSLLPSVASPVPACSVASLSTFGNSGLVWGREGDVSGLKARSRNHTVDCLWSTSNSCRPRKQGGRSCFWQDPVLRTQLQIYPISGASVKWVLHKMIWKFPLSHKMLWCMICLLIAADDWICLSNKCVEHGSYQVLLCISGSVKREISILHILIRWLLPGLKVRMMFTTSETHYRPQTYIWKQAETKQISSLAGAACSMKRKRGKKKPQFSNGNCRNNSGVGKGVKMSFLWHHSFSWTQRALGT